MVHAFEPAAKKVPEVVVSFIGESCTDNIGKHNVDGTGFQYAALIVVRSTALLSYCTTLLRRDDVSICDLPTTNTQVIITASACTQLLNIESVPQCTHSPIPADNENLKR